MKRLLLFFLWHHVVGFEDRVVGGPRVDIDRFPYMVSMTRIGAIAETVLCSGSIIHVNWILTAAHCVYPIDQFRVRVGSSFVYHGGDVYDPAAFITHPKYVDKKTYWVDIALIKLTQSIKLSRTIQTIRIAGRGTDFPYGTGCEFTGYGKTKDAWEDAQEGHLRYLGMPILKNEDCKKYGSFGSFRMLCAGFNNIQALACSVSCFQNALFCLFSQEFHFYRVIQVTL
jgi:Trypsin